MFTTGDIVVFALEAGVVVAAALFAWPWGRRNNRFAVAALTTALGVTIWNAVLNQTDAVGFTAEASQLRISWQDAGSGVLAFTVTALVLGLVSEPAEQSRRVMSAAALAGLIACVMDIWLL